MSVSKQLLTTSPWSKNAENQPRRVGVELEIAGFDLDRLTQTLAQFFNLRIEQPGRYERKLIGDPAGDWMIELDFDLLKKIGREPRALEFTGQQLEQTAEDLLAWTAEMLVPLEVVSPPLPLTRLTQVEDMISHLRDAGAKGTSDSLINAFGMQFNPELPRLDAAFITRCLQAFVCLYDWLFKRANIDMTRRITSYVNPYPKRYAQKITQANYQPDLDQLIDDYLMDNPTRNHALDMLPLFAHLDPERVAKVTQDALIKPRPTFHYRLPDCNIHEANWGLYLAWNDWVEVERLAEDTVRLQACCDAYHDYLNNPLKNMLNNWADITETEWLNPLSR